MLACAFEHTDRPTIIRMLLAQGAEINRQSKADSKTALHVAAKKGAIDAVEILIRRGADPTLRDNRDASPAAAALVGAELATDCGRKIACQQCYEILTKKLAKIIQENYQRNVTPEKQREMIRTGKLQSNRSKSQRYGKKKKRFYSIIFYFCKIFERSVHLRCTYKEF